MLVLRCTRKLLRRLHQKPARAVPESSTTLGDWYADLIHLGRKPVVLAVSARTLLPVLVPARESQLLPARLADGVGRTLEALGIRRGLIAEERRQMEELVFAPTASRQILGSMNDFNRMLDVAHQGSLLESALELGQAPCGPIGMEEPARATVKLFASGGEARIVPLRAIADAYELKVTLCNVRPPIWRRLRVAGSLTLRDLHHVLQIAFGWTDSHLHEFESAGVRYGLLAPESEEIGQAPLDERKYTLAALLRAGDRLQYLYDFGDGWRHEIEVEKSLGAIDVNAECIAGERAGPPEDCGGPPGFERLRLTPQAFDLPAINRELRGAGTSAFRRKREALYEGG